jgi:hypothetical protein
MHLLPTVKSRVLILAAQLIYLKALRLIQRLSLFKPFFAIVQIRQVIRSQQALLNFAPRLQLGQKLN